MKDGHDSSSILSVMSVAVVCYVLLAMPAMAEPGAASNPTLIINSSPVLKLDGKSKVVIIGSGYVSGQEVRLPISQSDGSLSDIEVQLDPQPVANEFGVWATAWTVGAFANKRIGKAGLCVLQPCDAEYNVLASTPLGCYDATQPYKEWPSWGRAVGGEVKKEGKNRYPSSGRTDASLCPS